MKIYIYLSIILIFQFKVGPAQTILKADGEGDTYELINSVLAPGYDVVEVPDCSHPEFGRHIDEVFDSVLNEYVFRFHIHVTPDNDRCIKFDRQRNEIKSYDKSPDSLKAVVGELVEYKWKFKLDTNFQSSSSFTHIHQIKAVGGSEDDMPLITLTTRKGSPDKLELRYAEKLSQTTLKKIDLDPLKGEWVEATETILYGEKELGEYDIVLTKVSDGTLLFNYSNSSIRMWKTNASFLRPKWGIYRSLLDSANLRDEEVLFADFRVEELKTGVSIEGISYENEAIILAPNPFDNQLIISDNVSRDFLSIDIYNSSGKLVLSEELVSKNLDVSSLDSGIYFIVLRSNKLSHRSFKMIKN